LKQNRKSLINRDSYTLLTNSNKMIITKEQQEALVDKYIKEKHNQDECVGFIDGLNAMLELISKIAKRGIDEHNELQYRISESDF
jgi:hypothetical protein